MNAKQFLSLYRTCEKRVDSKMEQLIRCRARLQSLTASYSDMPRGGKSKDWTDLVVRCTELEEMLEDELKELYDLRHSIVLAIEALENPMQRTVLELRYLNGYSWQKIMEKTNYADRSIFRMHYDGLMAIAVPDEFR